MTIHLHHLKGCSPVPLAFFLKALGILRLVSEQADTKARGWWQDEHFCLLTVLNREELECFFSERYQPTPVFNPWGGRSGYYTDPSEKTARIALGVIESSRTDRLAEFRAAIALLRSVIEHLGGKKPKSSEEKSKMISQIRNRLRGSGANWLDTVIVDLGDSTSMPAIMGTGGNEGSGSYTAAFLAAVVECIVRQEWNHAVASSLWGDDSSYPHSWDGSFRCPNPNSPNKLEIKQPFRQFLPEGEGSPWDLLFAFEGAVVIQSGVARKSSTSRNRFLSSSFYFEPMGVGAGSSSEYDEFVLKNGRKNPGRGEQWFPLWSKPSSFAEIQTLFREGRCTIGKRVAGNPIDAARAINRLGTTRGIASFLRYGYLQRNNLATHFAVPLGRIRAAERSEVRLIDGLSDWMARVHRQARKKSAPSRLKHAHKRMADVVLTAMTQDPTPYRWQAVLRTAVGIEAIQATGTAIDAGPIPLLNPEWIRLVDDGTAEFRLAISLGSGAAGYSRDGHAIDPIRHHWLPLESGARRFRVLDKRLVGDPRVVMFGRNPIADYVAIVERRLIEAAQKGHRRLPLVAAKGCGARLSDLAAFLSGTLDIKKILDLARAFMAIRWNIWSREHYPLISGSEDKPEEAWLALRLACLAWPLASDKNIPAEAGIVRRLLAGNSAGATSLALSRLRSAGIRPPLQAGVTDGRTTQRWAAALVFPISHGSAWGAAIILDPATKGLRHA